MRFSLKIGVRMNVRSLKLIRDVIINSGKLTSVEIAQDSVYLEFKDVELGSHKFDDDFSLTVRFAGESFLSVFPVFLICFITHSLKYFLISSLFPI